MMQNIASNRPAMIAVVIAGFFLAWELACDLFHVPNYFLPPPSAILKEFMTAPDWYLQQCLYTLLTTMLGFGAAFAVGLIAAIGITYSKILENTLYTLLVSLNSVPKIALAPLFIIWLGTGINSKVAVSFLIALFSIVIDTVLGLRSADPDALDLLKTMHGSPMQALMKIRIPTALPHMFAGMKISISLALVGAIAGEFVASQEGLGWVILSAQGMFQTTRVFAAIILLGVMGTVLFFLVDVAERLVCPWHVSHRTAEAKTMAQAH
ncbi:MAG TPA: ABC transporter permease [Alphaproteobacteria bacterium]|nr:ABC transporter permease [Alphaproteobacteria bacterium]